MLFRSNRCALFLHEKWRETIEESAKLFFQLKDIKGAAKILIELHKKMNSNPKTISEIHFYQEYKSDLNDAYLLLQDYLENDNLTSFKEAWDIYHSCFDSISKNFKDYEHIDLKNISLELSKFNESQIEIPGIYKDGVKVEEGSVVKISSFSKNIIVFNSKQHPRKIVIYGSDGKEYPFLLKGHDDLRQDERVMQLFDLVNIILAKDKSTSNKKLFIETYTIFPISHNAGLIGWVKNCDTLHQLIREQRNETNTIPSIEHKKIYKLYPKFESGLFLTKVETFKEAIKETPGTELRTVIWEKSKNCETWLNRRTNYSRSLAVMSIVGYILGLGDRHPSNLMMSRNNGKIIHIDFGDCFEVTMKREKFPERVPFRLTRMLIKALEVAGIEGIFRLVCIQIMELLRKKKDSLLAILGSFIHDPLISFRLMIPMIIRKRKRLEQIKITGNKKKNDKTIKNVSIEKNNINNKGDLIKVNSEENLSELKININDNNIESHSVKNNLENSFKKMNKFSENSVNGRKGIILKGSEKVEKKSEELKMDGFSKKEEEGGKAEKKKMEDDERLIFNLFEENDEIESEELNKIGQMVLERIKDKLAGTDIHPDFSYDAQTQVDKLIYQATSFENLAQSYLGWCPFW